MMRRYLFLFLCMIGLILNGSCSNNTKSETGEKQETPQSLQHKGIVMINDETYEMKTGGYSWQYEKDGQTIVTETDHAPPSVMAKDIVAIHSEKEDQIEIVIEGDPELQGFVSVKGDREKAVSIDDNQLFTPNQNGSYTYEIIAEWLEGEMSYVFVIQVE